MQNIDDRIAALREEGRRRIDQRIRRYRKSEGLIDLTQCYIDDLTIDWVVSRLQLLDDLVTLDISFNSIGEAGATAIAQHLTGLTTLILQSSDLGNAGTVAIAKHLTALTTLRAPSSNIGPAGALAIAEHLTALTTLDIRSNGVGETGAVAIAERLTALKTLDIESNHVGEVGAVAIAEHLTALTTLHIASNDIGKPGSVAIAKRVQALTTLDIRHNNIGEKGAVAIAERLTKLKTLHISGNHIGEAGAVAIAEHLTAVTSLGIRSNGVGEIGAVAIAERLTALKTLDITDNGIGEAGAVAIAKHLTALTTLEISDNSIGDLGVVAIAKHLTDLTTLDCACNGVGDAGAVAIVGHLLALTTLGLRFNSIGDADAIVNLLLERSRPNHQSVLETIVIANNPLRWTGTDTPISQETLLQIDPTKLLHLLLDSRPGVGENLSTARVTMAGLGMSGKTRLSRWLADHPNKKEEIDSQDRTIGVEQLETEIDGELFNHATLGKITLTIFDCGGQKEQLQSHHNLVYKASGRSLFILCLHAGKDFRSREGNRADYYLRMLQSYRSYGDPPLPVVIVVTHGELTGTPARHLVMPSEHELRSQYELLRITTIDPYLGKEGKIIEEIQRAIADFLAAMPEIRARLPKGIRKLQAAIKRVFQLEERTASDPRELQIRFPSLSPKRFRQLCIDHGVSNTALHGDYLRHLADLGSVIAPGVERTITADVKRLDAVVSQIFNPRYINQYVYGLLMNSQLRKQQGFMFEEQFRNETTRLTEAKREGTSETAQKIFDCV